MTVINQKQTIGRLEKVSFPDFGFINLDAKIDTGAYTAALHCHDIEVKNENGENILHFKILDPTHPEYNKQDFMFKSYSEKNIKNSFGDFERRYIISTRIKIGHRIVKTSISLSDRGNMRYPVLIGRKLLKKRFIVDVTETYILKKN